MNFQMPIQMARFRKLLITDLAHARLLARMNPQVICQINHLGKRFLTERTRKWFLPCMDAHVFPARARIGKAFVTVFACERLFARMYPQMAGQMARLRETLITNVAGIWPDVRMVDGMMVVQSSFAHKTFAANMTDVRGLNGGFAMAFGQM